MSLDNLTTRTSLWLNKDVVMNDLIIQDYYQEYQKIIIKEYQNCTTKHIKTDEQDLLENRFIDNEW